MQQAPNSDIQEIQTEVAYAKLIEHLKGALASRNDVRSNVMPIGELAFGRLKVQVQNLEFVGPEINDTYFLIFSLDGILDINQIANMPNSYSEESLKFLSKIRSEKKDDNFKPRIVILTDFTKIQFGANIMGLEIKKMKQAISKLEAIPEYFLSIAIVPEGFRAEAFKQFINKIVNLVAKKPTIVYHVDSNKVDLQKKVVSLVTATEG